MEKDWFVSGEERSDLKLLRAMLRLLRDEGRENVTYTQFNRCDNIGEDCVLSSYFVIYVDGKKHIHIENNICSFYSEDR